MYRSAINRRTEHHLPDAVTLHSNLLPERRLLVYGASRAAGDPVQPYGADDYRDEAGILERIGPRRLRFELLEPRAFNSARHEVIELVRGR
jgi:hypothetical protein